MMLSETEILARLRVCRAADRPVPTDLLDADIERLERSIAAKSQRKRRDALIRRAALLLPQTAPHQQAALLASEAKAMARTWHLLRTRMPAEPFNSARDCLHAAALRAKLPGSQRQFYRILQDADPTDISGHGVVSGSESTITV